MAKSSKGGIFERTLSKYLSLWLSDGEDASWIWRTSQSGGRATTRAKKGERTSGGTGDLTFTDRRAAWFFEIFSIELKCGYKAADIGSLIDSNQKEPLLVQFWEQCERDRELSGARHGLLIIKRDRKIPLVIISSACYNLLVGMFNIHDSVVIKYYGEYYLVMMQLDQFFDWMEPKLLKELRT